jgi:hypothetical protein
MISKSTKELKIKRMCSTHTRLLLVNSSDLRYHLSSLSPIDAPFFNEVPKNPCLS